MPCSFDGYVTEYTLDKGTPSEQEMEIALWDTAGGEEYDRLRPLMYPGSSVVLLCFTVDSRDSFENAKEQVCPWCAFHSQLFIGAVS